MFVVFPEYGNFRTYFWQDYFFLVKYCTFFISLKPKISPDFTLSRGKWNYTGCRWSTVYKTWILHMHMHNYTNINCLLIVIMMWMVISHFTKTNIVQCAICCLWYKHHCKLGCSVHVYWNVVKLRYLQRHTCRYLVEAVNKIKIPAGNNEDPGKYVCVQFNLKHGIEKAM